MHGYEIQQRVEDVGAEMWTNVLSGSIYFAMNKMEQEGLIRAEAEERTGNRLRKIYAITEEGKEAYLQLIREALAIAPHSLKSDFPLGAALAGSLTRDERRQLLQKSRDELVRLKDSWLRAQSHRTDAISRLIIENDLAMIDRDYMLVEHLLAMNEDRWDEKVERSKATHVIIRTSGDYHGNPYAYEETVPIARYEGSQWRTWFQPRMMADVLRQLPGACAGDVFMVEDARSRTRTEFRAIHIEDGETD